MKNLLTLAICFLLLTACTGKTIFKKPKDLLSKEQMIDIWTDLFLASAARDTKTSTLERNINYIPLVLEKYEVDSLQFSRSNFYYTSRIEEYEKMFKEVSKRLEALKLSYQPLNKRDSLIKSNTEDNLDNRELIKN